MPRQVALDRGRHMVHATGLTDSKAQLRLLNQLVLTLSRQVGEDAAETVEALMALLTAIGPRTASRASSRRRWSPLTNMR